MRKFIRGATVLLGTSVLAFAVTGAANASTPTSGVDYNDGIQLNVRPWSPFGTVATWCNDRSTSITIYVGMMERSSSRKLPMQDINSGWTTYPTNVNFSPGGCESFRLYDYYTPGDVITAEGVFYDGGWTGVYVDVTAV